MPIVADEYYSVLILDCYYNIIHYSIAIIFKSKQVKETYKNETSINLSQHALK